MPSQLNFAVSPNQHWEIAELRVPVPRINLANNHKDDREKLFFYFNLDSVLIKPQIITDDDSRFTTCCPFQSFL